MESRSYNLKQSGNERCSSSITETADWLPLLTVNIQLALQKTCYACKAGHNLLINGIGAGNFNFRCKRACHAADQPSLYWISWRQTKSPAESSDFDKWQAITDRDFLRQTGLPQTADINELIGYKIRRWWPEVCILSDVLHNYSCDFLNYNFCIWVAGSWESRCWKVLLLPCCGADAADMMN